MSHNPLYIFLHVPKCAGTTLRDNIINNLKEEEYLLIYYERGDESPKRMLRSDKEIEDFFKNSSEEEKDKIKFIIGHKVFYGIHKFFPNKEARYITFFREPSDRTISSYNFLVTEYNKKMLKDFRVKEKIEQRFFINGKIPSFEEWLDKSYGSINETMSQFLVREKYSNSEDMNEIKKALDKFWFIGTTETFNEDVKTIYYLLRIKTIIPDRNVSNKTIKKEKLEKSLIKKMRKKNKKDYLLYREAIKRRKKFIKENKELIEKSNKFINRRFFICKTRGKIRSFNNNIKQDILLFFRNPLYPIFYTSHKLKQKFPSYKNFISKLKNEK